MDFYIKNLDELETPSRRDTPLCEVKYSTEPNCINFSTLNSSKILRILDVTNTTIQIASDSDLINIFRSSQIGAMVSWVVETDNLPLTIVGETSSVALAGTVSTFYIELSSISPLTFTFYSVLCSDPSSSYTISSVTGYVLFAGSQTTISSTGSLYWDISNQRLSIGQTGAERKLQVLDSTGPQMRLSATGGINTDYFSDYKGSIIISQTGTSFGIGYQAGQGSQSSGCIAIGYQAGTTQNDGAVAIGYQAGQYQETGAIAIGWQAGQVSQGFATVSIGKCAGQYSQQAYAVAVGNYSGQYSQGIASVAIGTNAGQYNQGTGAVAAGINAGRTNQGSLTVAMGYHAGSFYQRDLAVAIGAFAGETNQGTGAIAVGAYSGNLEQSRYSIGYGYSSGQFYQKEFAIAVGAFAGQYSQGTGAIAYGANAGQTLQGQYSIAIGGAGQTGYYQAPYSIGISGQENTNITEPYSIYLGGGSNRDATGTGSHNIVVTTNPFGYTDASTCNNLIMFIPDAYQSTNTDNYPLGDNSIYLSRGAPDIGEDYCIKMGGLLSRSLSSRTYIYKTGCIDLGDFLYASLTLGEHSIWTGGIIYVPFVVPDYGIFLQYITVIPSSNSISLRADYAYTGVSGFFMNPVRLDNTKTQALCYNTSTYEVTYSTAGVKTFVIDHPELPDSYLIHGCLEGPEAGIYYRGEGRIKAGENFVDLKLPTYTKKLGFDFTVILTRKTNDTYKGQIMPSKIKNGKFKVYASNPTEDVEFFWIVHGSRNNIETRVKKGSEIKRFGPYTYQI